MASFNVKIKSTSGGELINVTTQAESTVAELKEAIADKTDAPAKDQRLIYKGQVLKDDKTVNDYGIKEDHVLHMVRNRQSSNPSSTSPPVSSARPTPAANPSPLGGSIPTGGGEADPTAALHRQVMSNLAQNPEAIRNLIQSNPAMQQLMNSNPEMSHILNNPQLLRETLNIASNPSLLREQMRHTDRAMSNLEAHPEGFNALRRMYEDFQEPLMNAASQPDGTANTQNESTRSEPGNGVQNTSNNENNTSNTTSASPNTAPLPNPWAPGAGANGADSNSAANRLAGLNLGGNAFGGGLPSSMGNLGGMGGMDPNSVMQQMSDPNFRNAMSQFVGSDLGQQLLRSATENNPQLRGLMDANPGMREMMRNPETLRQMFSPEGLAAANQMQQMQQLFRQMPPGSAEQNPQLQGFDQAGLSSLLGGMQGFGAPQPVANPEETYSSQITQLQEMGFYDRESNIRALQATGGNVQAAVDRLLSQF